MSHDFNMPASIGRLRTEAVVVYLQARGWRRVDSRYADRVSYEGEVHAGGEPYQLYLPTSPSVPKYRTLLQRVIYKLSGIEDREPSEIIRDILAHLELADETRDSAAPAPAQSIRIRNSSTDPLRVRLDSRDQEYQLFPRESIELLCRSGQDGPLEIEHGGDLIWIRD
jgi:hypothetical protein